MGKKLKPDDLEKIIKVLPKKEQVKLREQKITIPWLEQNIEICKNLMKRDTYIGIPWFAAYCLSLWKAGMNNITALIFVIGVVYFVYTTFTTGTYGLNQRKVTVYEELLGKLK